MRSIIRHGQFLSLIQAFLSRNVEVDDFCAKFTALWIEDRDETYAKKATWSQPYDELLLAAWQRGEISESEFQKESATLWGYAEEESGFRELVDGIHSACSVFSPSPELQWEMNEEQFRSYIETSLADYQRLSASATRVA